MKLVVDKSEVLNALSITQGVISSRTNLPILSNVLLQCKDGNLFLSATDLDIGVKISIPAKVETESGVSVNGKRFFDFIKEIPEGEIEIVSKKNYNVHVSSGSVSARFYGVPEEEFPSLPTIKEISSIVISASTVSFLIEMTLFSAARDTSRYELNGILFELESDGIFRCVASDGKRLSLCETSYQIDKPVSFILPLKMAQELKRFLPESGDVTLKIGDNMVGFMWDNIEIVSRVIDGEYPHYRQVIPEEKEDKAQVESGLLLSALRRAIVFTSVDSHAVRLDFYKNKLIITKDSSEVGSSREEIAISFTGSDITIGVNPEYMIDLLRVVPLDVVKMEIFSPDRPIVIRDKIEDGDREYKYMYLLSPMRI